MNALTQQLSLPLACDEPLKYHDPQRAGFFSVLYQCSDGVRRQRSHKLVDLEEVVERLDPTRDTWVSQGEFFKPNRRVVNLWRMGLAYVDLDTYNTTGLAGRSPEYQVHSLLRFCEDHQIPVPSLVVYSGRGLQVKWLFDKPIPSKVLPRWQALQNELCNRLMPLGADWKARDASRVLRLVDTVNSKSGERAFLVHQLTTPAGGAIRLANGAVGYDFGALFDEVLPLTRAALEVQRSRTEQERVEAAIEIAARQARKENWILLKGQGHVGNLRPFIASELAWDRLADLRKLAELRGWSLGHGAPKKERDFPVFLAACFLAQAVVVPRLRQEVAAIAQELSPEWSAAEVNSCVSSVMARADQASRGERVSFEDKEIDPRYRWRNSTLIERLAITPEEERQMGTIIGREEAKRRDAERKRLQRIEAIESGLAKSREQWLGEKQQRNQRGRELRGQGLSWGLVAVECGFPSSDAARKGCS